MNKASDEIQIARIFLQDQYNYGRPTNARSAIVRPLKHIIEAWSGCHIHKEAVEAAAAELNLPGQYPAYSIKSLIIPEPNKLVGIDSTYREPHYCANLAAMVEGDLSSASPVPLNYRLSQIISAIAGKLGGRPVVERA